MANIKCKVCDFEKKATNEYLIKLIGILIIIFGIWSWTSYLFAGSGSAKLICFVIVLIGMAILFFPKQIQQYHSTKNNCPKCNKKEWSFKK